MKNTLPTFGAQEDAYPWKNVFIHEQECWQVAVGHGEPREWHRKKQRKEENVIPPTVKENWGFLENALQIMTGDPDGSTA